VTAATLKLIAFPGAPNLPIFAAIERGYFEDAGVLVTLETTPSSAYQIESLVNGDFQIAATAFDNVVAYQEQQGAVQLAKEPDLFVVMGATQLELSLVVAPDIQTYEDLRGRSLALDALATGFAFVLYHMLEHAGLDEESYTPVAVGATPQRWEAVKTAQHAGTLTIEPFTSVAVANGFRVLATSSSVLQRYQGGIFTASRHWAAGNADSLEAFIRGYLQGLAWTLDEANYADAVDILCRRMPAIKAGVVDAVMGKLLGADTGLTPLAALDPAGMRTVLELRSRYARPAKPLTDPEPYLDLRYYERARNPGTR
jgi:ABC-type nitrate/sulfonate/bicarbonate transport system substrate-binding protein